MENSRSKTTKENEILVGREKIYLAKQKIQLKILNKRKESKQNTGKL